MTIARVIPLRRLPPDRPFFDYLVADGLNVKPGCLVKIPFLKSSVKGIVWDLVDTTAVKRLRPLTNLVTPEPFISDWQRKIIDVIANEGATTIAQILKAIIPSTGQAADDAALPNIQDRRDIKPSPAPAGRTWWYRDRRRAWSNILNWCQGLNQRSKVILVPTIEDGQQIFDILSHAGIKASFIHTRTPAKLYQRLYHELLAGQQVVVIGTWRALTLPFSIPPLILLDQEDHPAYKQWAHYPRLDTAAIVGRLTDDYIATTSAPSLSWYNKHHPVPPPVTDRRAIITMEQPRLDTWITNELADLVTDSINRHQPIILITPQRGYASAMTCRDCGWIRVCPACRQPVRLFRSGTEQIGCRYCGHLSPLAEQCPRCRAWQWRLTGLGVERLAEIAARHWPTATIASLATRHLSADIYIDSYQAYHEVINLPPDSLIGLVSGDSLLNIPDYSVAERAWQWLARLQSMHPLGRIVVQTFNPTGDFWQRWQRGDDRAWYEHELIIRRQNQLPPFTLQWIAEYRDSNFKLAYKKLQTMLSSFNIAGLTVAELPDRTRSSLPAAGKILITFPNIESADNLNWISLFPLPWHLDKSPRSWLE